MGEGRGGREKRRLEPAGRRGKLDQGTSWKGRGQGLTGNWEGSRIQQLKGGGGVLEEQTRTWTKDKLSNA